MAWYNNPFRSIRGLVPERIDQGVDYSGTGPVYALGAGKILATTNTGWPGGGFIAEQLSQGPYRGQIVYVAEDITPAVHVGQAVNSNTVIGTMWGGPSGIETGWAAGGSNLGYAEAHVLGESTFPTQEGESYNQVLTSVGAPSGTGGPAASGPVTPLEVFQLLRAKGLTNAQAIGVMANMWYESRIDPESGGTDSNGYWAGGLISWNTQDYPGAHSLVTGNPQKDARAQIDYLFTHTANLQQGLQGGTAQEVAGNFAQHVEACASCQPGGQQWNARRAEAGTISGWESSGNWPLGGSSNGTSGGGTGGPCLVSGPSIPFIGSTGCLLSPGQARAVVGAGLIVLALPVGLVGAIVLAAFTFRRSGAGSAIGKAAEGVGGAVALIPGAEPAGLAIAAAGSQQARRSQASQADQQQRKAAADQRAQERNDERQYRQARARFTKQSGGQAPPDDFPF